MTAQPAEAQVAQETPVSASVTVVTPPNIFAVTWESAQNQRGNTGNDGNTQIDKFLARVVPSCGYVAICFKGKNSRGMGTRFFPCDRLTDAGAFVNWCVQKKMDVWFGCASYREVESGTTKGGTPTLKGSRTQENVEALQSLYMDLDIKREGDGKAPEKVHADVASAIAWLKGFCTNTGMPLPNLWVSSGYGLHLYWILKNAIERVTWQPYADARSSSWIFATSSAGPPSASSAKPSTVRCSDCTPPVRASSTAESRLVLPAPFSPWMPYSRAVAADAAATDCDDAERQRLRHGAAGARPAQRN
jgi:hypothetical protein